MNDTELTDRNFNRFRELVFANSGISLNENKRELVRTRLGKRIRELDLKNFNAYFDYVTADKSGQEIIELIDAISTNVTFFFRENKHFEYLKELALPEIMASRKKKGDKRIRLWSAACSTGEEPYTMAIVLKDFFEGHVPVDTKILATDISTKVLKIAETAVYPEPKLKGVGRFTIQKYFDVDHNEKGQKLYRLKREVKNLVVVRRLNLMTNPYPFKGKFSVIFCRNVMIYFDRATQEMLINRLHDVLEYGGYLFIGHSESLTAIKHPFRYVAPTIYQRVT